MNPFTFPLAVAPCAAAASRLIAAVAAALVIDFAVPLHAHAQQQMRMATPYADASFQTRNVRRFVQDLRTATGGKLDLSLHTNASLLKGPEIFPAVQRGDVQFGEIILSSMVKESQLFGIDAIPFLANGYTDARKLWKIARPATEAEFAKRGLTLLYAVPWPPNHLYSIKPVERTLDMEGLRFRAYNPATQRIAELSGAKPTQIDLADVPKALREERIDVMLTSSIAGVDAEAWKRMRYVYTVGAWAPKNVVFMNKKVFDALDEETKKQLREVAARAEERGWTLSEEADHESQRELARNSIKVLPPSLLLSTQFRHLGDRMAHEWVKVTGFQGLQIILDYEALRASGQ